MRVLLTGAAGFIGSHVARALLACGDEIVAVVRPTTDLVRLADIKDRMIFASVDLDDHEALRRVVREAEPEACVHLAWYAVPGRYLHAADENLTCLHATINLVRELISVGCQRFVGAGTCIELDTDAGYLTPGTPPRPRSVYAAAKHAAQVLASQLCRASHMSFAWVRVFYQFGPFEDHRRLVPQVIKSLFQAEQVELTSGEQVRDYVHVADVAEAFAHVLHSDAANGINLGSGQPVTVRHLVQTLGHLAGRPELLIFGAKPMPSDEPPFICADPTAVKAVGWVPRFDLEGGLRDTLDWWRGHLFTRGTGRAGAELGSGKRGQTREVLS